MLMCWAIAVLIWLGREREREYRQFQSVLDWPPCLIFDVRHAHANTEAIIGDTTAAAKIVQCYIMMCFDCT